MDIVHPIDDCFASVLSALDNHIFITYLWCQSNNANNKYW